MKILVAAIHWPVASARFITAALRRLGNDVRTLGPSTGNAIWGLSVDMRHAWQADYPMPDLPSPHIDFDGWCDLSPDWQPDLVITADSAYTITGSLSCPHVLWGVDNHVRDYRLREWDAMFLAHSWGQRTLEPGFRWLPAAYDPKQHRDLGWERPFDAGLCGMAYAERVAIMRGMTEAGMDVQPRVGLIGDEYNAFYNLCKIALVRSICGDLAQRFLENMAQGCCVLSDRAPDAARLGFVAGVDYWPYERAEDAVTEARYLLESGRWREIAANGKRKVLEHTWDRRCETLLENVLERQPWSR